MHSAQQVLRRNIIAHIIKRIRVQVTVGCRYGVELHKYILAPTPPASLRLR